MLYVMVGQAMKRSRRSRQTPSPISYQDENSIAFCSTLNTAFIDISTDHKCKKMFSER